MRDYTGTISIDTVDFWIWVFSTFPGINDDDPHYVVDWSTWKDGHITIRDDSQNELEIDTTDFIIWVASDYMASAHDEFVFEPPIIRDGYIEIKFKASDHCNPRTWNNECIITNTYICPHKEISSTKCSSCKIVDRVNQRQDSTSDQLQDLIRIANKTGMYDAADLLSNLLKEK